MAPPGRDRDPNASEERDPGVQSLRPRAWSRDPHCAAAERPALGGAQSFLTPLSPARPAVPDGLRNHRPCYRAHRRHPSGGASTTFLRGERRGFGNYCDPPGPGSTRGPD